MIKEYPQTQQAWDWESLTMETNRISLLYNPAKAQNKEPWMWYSLHQIMKQGNQVTIYTPYIICGREMYEDLSELKEKDISVEIITNDVASGANPWGCTDYLNQKKNIWKTGAKVYEFMGEHSCHTKAVLVDERMSIVGSYNLDMRSTYQDTELMLAVDSTELNAVIQEEVKRDKTYSKITKDDEYVYGENYQEKEMSVPKKIFYGILRVVTIFFTKKNTIQLVRPENLFSKFREIFVTGFSTFFIDIAMGVLTILYFICKIGRTLVAHIP